MITEKQSNEYLMTTKDCNWYLYVGFSLGIWDLGFGIWNLEFGILI
jgi:hypothetical protein